MPDYEANISGQQQALFDIETLPDEKRMRIEELRTWLDTLRDRELQETLRKAAQYDQLDLIVLGRTMATVLGVEAHDQMTAIQLGCAFFALGKISRIIGAVAGGRTPQNDDWYDLRIYGTMGLKTLETGKWA